MYKFMYKLILVFVLSCFACSLSAQSSQFAVEVGAFAERVPLSYFKKLNYKVYEALDVNEIYRYYIDVADEEKGQVLRAEAKAAGYNYARLIDFEAQRQLCANQCGYTPPTPTDPANRLTPPRPTKKGQAMPEVINNEVKTPKIVTYETLQKEDSLLRLRWIFFDFDKSNITKTAKIELEKVAEIMQKYPSYSVELYAHTDAKGSAEYNQRLSARRAEAARQELLRLGVPNTNIRSREFGKSNPIAANEINDDDTPAGRQFNRRVELQVFDRQGKIVNIVDETQIPNSLKIDQANTQLNKNIGDKSTPAAKPKKKKIINNHYDK